MTVLTATEAKSRLLEYVRNVCNLGEIYEITQRGQKSAFLMPPEVYEGLLETIEIMKDKELLKEINKSLGDIKKGRLHSFKEVVGREQKK